MEYKFLLGVLVAAVISALIGSICGIIWFGYVKPRLDKKKFNKEKNDKNL